MDDPQIPARAAETEAELQARLAHEAALIAEAEAEADAGLLVPQAEVNAWLDSLETDHPLPMPQPRRRR